MWEQSVNNKTSKELDESAQAARDRVIEQYRSQLNELENKISNALITLKNIEQDINKEHQKKLDAYSKHDQDLKALKEELYKTANDLDVRSTDITQRNIKLNESIEAQIKKIADQNTVYLAKLDQLKSLQAELDAKKIANDEAEERLKGVRIALDQRHKELEQFHLDAMKFNEELISKKHALQEEVEFHNTNVSAHQEEVAIVNDARQKNMAFYDALTSRELELEPLKIKLEAALAANEKEALRLRDENIKSYQKATEAEKRLQVAIEAEQRAASEISKLEALKQDIHSTIKKEQ